jgi:hypothetical protein
VGLLRSFLVYLTMFVPSAQFMQSSSDTHAVVRLWPLFAALSSRRPSFDPKLAAVVGCVVDKVALGQFYLRYFGHLLSVSFHCFSVLFNLTPTPYF